MAKQPDINPRDIYDAVAKLAAEVKALKNRSPFYGTGMHPNGLGGFDSDTYTPGTSGFRLDGTTGTPEFNDIKLRGGIIGNDALRNVVIPQFIYEYTSNFALTNSMSHLKRVTVTVPPGITSAIVNVTSRIYAVNDTSGMDYLYCQTNVAGYNGLAFPTPATPTGGSGTNVSPFAVTLYGLTAGSTFTVDIDGQTAFGSWAANASNQADVAGSILWFR